MISKTENLSAQILGKKGEEIAKDFLKKEGYKIVVTNFTVYLRRSLTGQPITGEIDIIAYDEDVLCFIEVKTRSSDFLPPEAAVNLRKQLKLKKVARKYRQLLQLKNIDYRFDVVAILLMENKLEIRLEKNFFSSKSKNNFDL